MRREAKRRDAHERGLVRGNQQACAAERSGGTPLSMFGGGFGNIGMQGAGPRGGRGPNVVKANEGLPFAGVPPELADSVERLERLEPDHGDPGVTFTHTSSFTGRIVRWWSPLLVVLVVAETL